MTAEHLIYIPVVLALGFVIGFIVGRKSLLAQLEARRETIKRRKARRQTKTAEAPETKTAEAPESAETAAPAESAD